MAQIAREGIEAGALGFTTSRTLNHRTSKGEFTPTLTADADELIGIARAIGQTGKGVLQGVSDFADVDAEFSIFRRKSEESGRPVSFSLVQVRGDTWRRQLELLAQANADGVRMTAQVAPRPVGLILGLECTLHPLLTNAVYREIASLPLAERVGIMRDHDFKMRVLAADSAQRDDARSAGRIIQAFDRMFELGDPPDYEPDAAASIGARAKREGREALDVAYDLLLEDGGRSLLYLPFLNYADGNLDAVGEMLAHPNTVIGLADGGAHLGTICDASFPTTLLTLWVRDRDHGRLDLPFAVQRHTSATARTVGLLDRGVLAPGYRADVNLIDFERLTARKPEMHHDLPAGGKRLVQSADGYVATLVAGAITYENGETCGPLPGRLVQGPQASPAGGATGTGVGR